MKRTSPPEKQLRAKSRAGKDAGDGPEEMAPEYRFDYRKAKPNRFAKKMSGGTVAVVLDPDVAAVFNSSEAVNQLLRSVIQAMPDLGRDRDR